MIQTLVKRAAVVGIVAVLITSVFAPIASVGLAQSTSSGEQSETAATGGATGPTVSLQAESGPNVTVWNKSVFPLRVDPANAATTIRSPILSVNASEVSSGEAPLNKKEIATFDTGDTITLDYQSRSSSSTDTSVYSNDNIKLVLARATDVQNFSIASAVALSSNLTSDDANENYEFTIPTTGSLNGDGEGSFDVTPSTPGRYALLLVNTEDGDVSASKGNISASNDVEIIGVDVTSVQSAQASLSSKNKINPGDSLKISVDANFSSGGSNVSHSVLLIDEDELSNQQVEFILNGTANASVPAENLTVKSTIQSVRGARDVTGTPIVLGQTLDQQDELSVFPAGGIIRFVGQSINGSGPNYTVSGSAVLDASISAKETTGASTSLVIRTASNIDTGEYTLYYLASENNSNTFSTQTKSLTIKKKSSGDGDGDDDDGPVPPEAALSAPSSVTVDQTVTLDASGSTDNAGIVSYKWDLDGDGTFERRTSSPTTSVTFDSTGSVTVTVEAIDGSGATDTASVSITVNEQSADTPADTTDTPTETTDTPTSTTDTPTSTTDTPTEPTDTPADTPEETPTDTPTVSPTDSPTESPTETPTESPTDTPTETPTQSPTPTDGSTPTVVTSATQTDAGIPGFTSVLGILALLAVAGIAARRSE